MATLTRAAQVDQFILSSLKEGKFSVEAIEDSIVCMALVKTHKEAKRRITQAQNKIKAQAACLLPEQSVIIEFPRGRL